MKKVLFTLVTILILLAGIALYRAESVYPDRQYYPPSPLKPVFVEKSEVAQRLSQAIQIPTVSKEDDSATDADAFIRFHDFLAQSFPAISQLATRHIINDYSLVYEFTGSDKSLKPMLFMGHMDVVPVDEATLAEWKHPPFAGEIADNQIWGRGALDDKATVVALMEAMEMQLERGNLPRRTLYFSFGHDEEIGGQNGAAKVAEYFKAQGTHFEMVLDEGGAVLQDIVAGFKPPVALIGVAEKGFVNIRMTVESTGGHSSMPPDHTAAGILAEAIVKLEAHPFPSSLEYTNLIFDAIGHYAEFPARLGMANQWLLSPLVKNTMLAVPSSAAGLRTTTAVTMLQGSSKSNILPTQATAVANFRIIPGETWQSVLAFVEKAIDDPRVKLEVFMNNNPSTLSPVDSAQFKMLEHTIREFSPNTLVAPYLVQGGTDAKHFVDLSDSVYRFLMVKLNPETLHTFHGINERINIDDYVLGIQYFYELFNKASFNKK